MGPYSHIILASELEKFIKPDNAQEYYWGAIAPDTRYLMQGMNRKQTHISSGEIMDYMGQYPELESFLQGYLVHCVTDQLDLPKLIQQKIPLSLQKNELSTQQSTVILEFFNILRTKPVKKTLSEESNIVLEQIGIGKEQAIRFAHEMNQYISSPSFVSLLNLYQNMGLVGNGRIEKYKIAFQRFQGKWFRKNVIMFFLHVGRLNEEIILLVKSNLPNEVVL